MHRFLAATAVAACAIAGSLACATKTYVQRTVGDAEGRVTSLGNAVEEVQAQTQKNGAEIRKIDTDVQAVRQAAQQANQSAKEAVSLAKTMESRTEALETFGRRIVYETVLSQDGVTFEFDKSELSGAAKQELTALVEFLKRETRNVVIAIEGHTDSTGPQVVNERIGLERARAVEQYLYEEHHIPLTKMDVISYGEERPVAPNTTTEGRAQNRRVVIKVMT